MHDLLGMHLEVRPWRCGRRHDERPGVLNKHPEVRTGLHPTRRLGHERGVPVKPGGGQVGLVRGVGGADQRAGILDGTGDVRGAEADDQAGDGVGIPECVREGEL